MRCRALSDPVSVLPGIGPVRTAQFAAVGIEALSDLLFHLPSAYQDRRRTLDLATARASVGEMVVLEARLDQLRQVRLRRRGTSLHQAKLSNEQAELRAIWFNRPYLGKQVELGARYRFYGEVKEGKRGVQLVNPEIEKLTEESAAGSDSSSPSTSRVVPVYPSRGEIGPALFRRLIRQVFDAPPGLRIEDPLPLEVRERRALPALGDALRSVHVPKDDVDVAALAERRSPGHKRLIYGELLELQLALASHRLRARQSPKGHDYRIDGSLRKAVRAFLPFRLTAAQTRVLGEIVEDLRRPTSMLRLLQGDVGSGKTVVAAVAMLAAAHSGFQSALMVPTEVLAEQHFDTLRRLLEPTGQRVELITASHASAGARRRLAVGDSALAVGTHALIQESTRFQRLALAVVDEQHRFGVDQRAALEAKGARPDVLVMTATPIPRSLALVLYGDLDVSVIDELPPGRSPVETVAVPAAVRERVLHEITAELESGGQAYVVFPRIDGGGRVAAEAVEELGQRYRERWQDHGCEILTGRTPADERHRVLTAFGDGRIRVLVATTVIEVGLDVPEASIMVIESAERFGVAQLHQLRGRIGRGARASRCYLVHGELSREAERRLEILVSSGDGFEIAEADLAIRGPGELVGRRQAGDPHLGFSDLVADLSWVQAARDDARSLVEADHEVFRRLVRSRDGRDLATVLSAG